MTVRLERAEAVAVITLDRPDRLNAVDRVMVHELIDAIDEAERDGAVGATVITGAGRAFCAGADLRRGASAFADDEPDATIDSFRDFAGLATLRLFDCRKPVIGAINGPAVGFGATLTCAMDVRLAAETATFVFAFARRGMVPEGASGWFLPRIVGIGRALEWSLTGRAVPAEEARAAGLVNTVLPEAELLDAAVALGEEIARSGAPIALALTRKLLWHGLVADHPREVHELDSRATFVRGRSADVAEGVTAFLEKRAPAFPQSLDDLDGLDEGPLFLG